MALTTDHYRRGLTLGLTMAEIFMLLLFLLLLSVVMLSMVRAKAADELLAVADLPQQINDALAGHNTEPAAPDDLPASPRRPLPEIITHLTRDLHALYETAQDVILEVDADRVSPNLSKRALLEENRILVVKLENLSAETADIISLQAENLTLQHAIAQLQEELAGERGQTRAALIDKGIDPPCWYAVAGRTGKRYEKTHFLMDIAVHDEFLRVRPRPAPPGRAVSELGRPAATRYIEEYARLPLDPFATERELTLAQFTEYAAPIRRMGKDKQVRDYACVFHALVWDRTSKTAKERWQQAQETIEQSFYTLRVVHDPWEQAHGAP